MAPLDLNEDTLARFVRTGDESAFGGERQRVVVDGRTYALVVGSHTDVITGEMKTVYAVATPDDLPGGWRLALLAEVNLRLGFNHLIEQTQLPQLVPQGTPARADAALFLDCVDRRRGPVKRFILAPYKLPFRLGDRISGTRVEQVGIPLYLGDNTSAIVPLRTSEGTYTFVLCKQNETLPLLTQNPEAAELVRTSTEMPIIRDGIGSDVWHVVTYHGDEAVLIKVYYNTKADRGVEVCERSKLS